MNKIPKRGTVQRAAFDAAHMRWCGPEAMRHGTVCSGAPDLRELTAIIAAVRRFDDERKRS